MLESHFLVQTHTRGFLSVGRRYVRSGYASMEVSTSFDPAGTIDPLEPAAET